MTQVTRTPCQLYLISPLDVGGDFPARLEEALAAAPVAAFQFRVKGVEQHEAARLAEPLQAICAAHDTAFIVNDDVALAKRLGAERDIVGAGIACLHREVAAAVAGHADLRVEAEDAARLAGIAIVLPQMQPVGAEPFGERDIVVDDEGGVVRGADRLQRFR